MNINIISEITPSQQSGQSEANLSVDADLFQQLLQVNKNSINTVDKLHHSLKQSVTSDSESDDTEQNLDIVAMIIPSLDSFVEAPVQLLTGNTLSKEADQLNTAILTTSIPMQNELNQANTSLLVDEELEAKPASIINQPVTSLPFLSSENQPLLNAMTQGEMSNQLVESAMESITKPVSVETSTQDNEELPLHNVTQIFDNNLQTANLSESQLLTDTSSKAIMINSNQLPSFIPDNHIANQLFTQATPVSQTMNLSMPVNLSQWQTSLTEQIVMLTRQDIQTAEIKLHPQELGSLHIKLAMQDDNMQLHLMTAHNLVKGVLESALPFLKTSLEQQGITLQQADVSDFSMMNDSQHSAMFNQANQQPALAPSEAEEQTVTVEQSPLSQSVVPVGLSIFA